MTALQKMPRSSTPCGPATWAPTDDLVRLDQIVRIALDDPRHAASHVANWLDCNTTHHEGSDAARVLDNWAHDPRVDSLDGLAWYVRKSRDHCRFA